MDLSSFTFKVFNALYDWGGIVMVVAGDFPLVLHWNWSVVMRKWKLGLGKCERRGGW